MTRKTLEAIAVECGAILEGNTITFEDEDLKELSPSFTFTSPKTVAQEVGRFILVGRGYMAGYDWLGIQESLEKKWGTSCDEWWDKEWECYEATIANLNSAWLSLALNLFVMERKA